MAGQLGVPVHVGASAEDAVAVAVDGGGSAVVGGVPLCRWKWLAGYGSFFVVC